MSNTDDHIQIISSSPTGATIATDYHSGTQRHWQVVKLNTGSDGVNSLLSNTNPLPVSYTNAVAQTYVPVAGNTAGTDAITTVISGGNVSADISGVTVSVGDITVIAGTLGNVQLSGGTLGNLPAGATIDVVNTITSITNAVSITADGLRVEGATVDVATVAIPSGITTGHVTADNVAISLGSFTIESGVRVTNQGPDPVFVGGNSGVTTDNGYKLANLDSIFLEVSDASSIYLITAGVCCDVRYIGS
jgi:hypothetical protein